MKYTEQRTSIAAKEKEVTYNSKLIRFLDTNSKCKEGKE
jgi:hypothetical protein